jgi:hypothetical protein
MAIRVLWIEDGAKDEVKTYAPPLRTSPRFSLDIALTATDGMSKIRSAQFDVVVVDIRLEPGTDEYWRNLHIKQTAGGGPARLGLELLRRLLPPDPRQRTPGWIRPEMIGVLTIEPEEQIGGDIAALGIQAYCQKELLQDPRALLHLVERIVRACRHGTTAD